MVENSRTCPHLPALCMLVLLLLTAGCAANLSGPERMRLAGHELSQQYLQLHRQYLELMQHLPDSGRRRLRSHVAPMLNRLKHSLVTFNKALLALGEEPPASAPSPDLEAMLMKIGRLAGMAAQLLQEAAHDRY